MTAVVNRRLSIASSTTAAPGPRRPLVDLAVVWVPTLVGCAVLAVAAIMRSMAVTNVGAGVTAAGLLWVPAGLLLRRRLATLSRPLMLAGAVLIVQAMHTVEHVVQIIESYRLDFPPARSLGIISPLNVEWVHFGWNWLAWVGVAVAFWRGLRSGPMVATLAWITAHSLEHTYMLLRYLDITAHLDALGVPRLGSSEVLPGILGRDGWLALHAPGWRTTLGPLVSAPRVAIHLWWNIGEVALLAVTCAWAGRRASTRA